MRVPKPEWLAALRSLCGDQVRLSWNEAVGRWQFDVLNIDGEYRAQFFCWTHDPVSGRKLEPEPHGYLPFRELTDDSFREVLRNLEETFIGNPFDGARDGADRVRQRARFNADQDARARRDRINGIEAWLSDTHNRRRGNASIQVASVIGSPKS